MHKIHRTALSSFVFSLVVAGAAAVALPNQAASGESTLMPASTDASLLKQPKSLGDGASYYTFKLENGSTAHVVLVDLRKPGWRIRPATGPSTKAVSQFAKESHAAAAINGGYFNLSDGEGASYIVCDGQQLCDPHANKALTNNPRLQPFLETIYKRSEIRFLKDKSGTTISITPHPEPLPTGKTLIDSLQAGPALVPIYRAQEEAFIRTETDGKKADSIGCGREAARSAFGVTAEGKAMFVAVAGKGQDPESAGISLPNLVALLGELGCSQAINLDGGASSTMFVDLKDGGPITVCGKSPETRVKSVLLLERVK